MSRPYKTKIHELKKNLSLRIKINQWIHGFSVVFISEGWTEKRVPTNRAQENIMY